MSGRRLETVTLVGFTVAGALVLLRLAAVFVDVDPALPTAAPMQGPSWAHLLGTDQLGRDLASRMVVATEAFFFPGLFACAIAVVVGVPAGAAVGYWPRSPAAAFLRGALTIVGAWPRLVVVVVVIAIFKVSLSDPAEFARLRLYLLGGLVGITFVPQLAMTLSEKVLYFQREQFVEAARAHGIPEFRILGFHILWANCRALVLRQACTLFGAFLLIETSLSYLGDYGVPAPRPSWGNILADLKFSVTNTRRLLIPESWTPAEVLAAVGKAVEQGGALGVLAPTAAIGLSIVGVLALAEHFARRDPVR